MTPSGLMNSHQEPQVLRWGCAVASLSSLIAILIGLFLLQFVVINNQITNRPRTRTDHSGFGLKPMKCVLSFTVSAAFQFFG